MIKKTIQMLFASLCVVALITCTEAHSEEVKSAKSVTVVESSQSWDGTTLPNYPSGTPKVTILKITIPPKVTLKLHKHPVINVGILTKGELTVVKKSDGKTLTLRAGDGIVELVNQYHYGVNNGDEPAEIIVFYAGNKESKLVEFEK